MDKGCVLASIDDDWNEIFKSKETYLKSNPNPVISDAEKLKGFCLKNLKKNYLLRNTNFLEKACSLSIKQVISKRNKDIKAKSNKEDYLQDNQNRPNLSNLGKRIIRDRNRKQFADVVKEAMNWCDTNLSKIYSHETKDMENDLIKFCFKRVSKKK